MKVLQLIDTLSFGGAERMCVNIANLLCEKDIKSMLVVCRKTGPLAKYLHAEVDVKEFQKKSSADIITFFKILRYIRQAKPDIIHAHSTSVIWGFFFKLFYPGIRLIWHDHNGMQVFKDGSRSIYRHLSFCFDGVVVVNNNLLNWCKENLKVKRDNIVYLKNFPSLIRINKSFNISGEPVLVCLANLRPVKDQINIITALDILQRRGMMVKLKLAGGFVDAAYHLAIVSAISQFQLGNKVELLGAVDDVSTLLSKADIGIISSESEGLPVALLEYGMAGLPVICTDAGQCKEVLGDGKYGTVIPAADSIALADAISAFISHPAMASQKAIAFNKHVIEEYGSAKFSEGYFKLLRNIIQ